MTGYSFFYRLEALLLFLIHLAVIARVILRPHREPASRIAWIVMIIALPVVGMIAYLFLARPTSVVVADDAYGKCWPVCQVLRMRLARMRPPYRPKSRSVMSICSALDTG